MLLGIFCLPMVSIATHLVGGNLGYEYVGIQPDGTYRYKITGTTYINCDGDSNFDDPEDEIFVGVYEIDINDLNANKILVASLTLPLVENNVILDDIAIECAESVEVCLKEGKYETFVNLPVNIGGYLLTYNRCCRNGNIINLNEPGDEGVTFTTSMPSPLIENNSPVFTTPPVPFLCQNDLSTFLNSAIDPDGDQLVFSFIHPLNGEATPDPGQANPIPPAVLNFPISNVVYETGFNQNQPFGGGGTAFINGATGLTQYLSPNSGNYVVAVEIREYRNNILIGTMNRDLQILVLNCPPNPAPDIQVDFTQETEFQTLAGDSICFQVNVVDNSGDSLILTSSGQIFDPLLTFPTATINTPIEGVGSITADFCWHTSCDQGQELPYQFIVGATDNGCPPKTTNEVFQIQVIPFDGSTFIDGNPNPCEDAIYQYDTNDFDGATYNWIVDGGIITTGQGTNVISVDWGASGPGMVTVIATNSLGCVGDPFDLNVNIQSLPPVDAGVDVEICLGDTVSIGGAPTGPNDALISWSPSDSISSTTAANPNIFPIVTTDYIVQVVTGFSCVGQDTINVQVNTPQIDAGEDMNICLGGSAELNGSNGISYLWSPSLTLSQDDISNPVANPIDTTTYFVSGPDANSCIGIDSMTVFVLPQPISNAGPDTVICGLSYDMQAIPSVGQGIWRPQIDVSYDDNTSPTTQVIVDLEGIYTFTWVEGNLGCQDSSEVTVQFIAQPIAEAGLTDSICGLQYDLGANPSVGLGTWTFPAGITFSTNLNDPNTQITAADFGTFTIQWDELNGICADTSTIEISFIEQPIVNAGLDDSICGLEYDLGASISAGVGTWTAGSGTFSPNENDPNATITSMNNGVQEIIWFANNQDFCFAQDTVLIDFQEIPTADAGEDQSLCADSTILNASTTGIGTWVFPIDLILDDINDPMSPVNANANGIYTLFWNTEIGMCTNIDSVQIEFLQAAIADVGADVQICIGEDVQLNGSFGDSYNWTPNIFIDDNSIPNPTVNPDETTEYILEVELLNGCTDSDSILITVNDLPVVDAGEDIDYLCDGDSIQLNASPGFASYSWVPTSDVSNPAINNPFAIGDVTADYIVTVTDLNNCMNSDTVNIIINGTVPTNAGPDFEICLGDSVQIGGSPVGPDGTTYLWSPVILLSDANTENPFAMPSETTEFIVQSTNSVCNGTDTVLVQIIEVDAPQFELSLVPGCSGLQVNFFNQGDDSLFYTWDFGDGSTSNEFSPSHLYAFNNTYSVSLEVESEETCIASTIQSITAQDFEEYFQIFVPNVFTPNQDGENDVMDINIQGNIQECLVFEVFNRWGQVMFNSTGNNTRWDGRTNAGKMVNPGVYFYVIELNGQVFKGDIQVLY